MIRQGLIVVGAGALLGGVVALGAAVALSSVLYGVSPGDPLAWGVALAIVAATSVLAHTVPARRVASVNPVVSPGVALRTE